MTDRERVARAIAKADDNGWVFEKDHPYANDAFKDEYFAMADAAISVLRPEAQAGVAEVPPSVRFQDA